jgi:diguanylate cyclase (GGDEF)-like protein
MRILIAEDDITSRNILNAILKKWGHDPVVTKDGLEAWEALQQPDAPRLVLLDWDMPGMEGLEVCRRLRENNSSNPSYVILLTGRGEKGDIVQGLEAGANDYIGKPYDNEELQARIGVGQRMLELQSSLVEARDALEHLAMHDPLTGVLSRRAILDRLKADLSRASREDGSLSVGMFDLDHFKQINDTYGHQAGDKVLIAFTQCIQDNLRGYDFLGRYGGEEFLVVAPGSRGQSEECLYERLCAQVAATKIETAGKTISITVSVGVAQGTGESTVDALLAEADDALYQAKADGRNRVVHATQAEVPPQVREKSIEPNRHLIPLARKQA